MSPSSYSRFHECSAAQLAVEKGDWQFEYTTAMKVGSYVDAYFSKRLEEFKAKNPDILKRDGELRAEFVKAEDIIRNIEADPLFLQYISGGETQKKVEGIIGGVPYIGYVDNYIAGKAIIDLKVIRNVREKIYDAHNRRWITWIESYGYIKQGAIYRELIHQETGELLPFFIAAIDKQTYSDKEVIFIPQEYLNQALEEVSYYSKKYMNIRKGIIAPERCEKCDYCKATKKIETVISLNDLINTD